MPAFPTPVAPALAPVPHGRRLTPVYIALLVVEYAGRKMLFCGDARCDYIVKGPSQAGYLEGESLHVDLMAVPHWGSRRSVTVEFFEKVTADHYVVGGNAFYELPDIETLQLTAGDPVP